MSEGFKKSSSYSDEWYTPKYIIDSLGKFDRPVRTERTTIQNR